MDPVQPVANEAMKVAEVMGMLLEYDSWKDHGLEALEKTPNLGVLKCFSALYTGAGYFKNNDVHRIAMILQDNSICHSVNSKYQEALLVLIDLLVDLFLDQQVDTAMKQLCLTNTNDKGTEECLYTLLVKLIALTEANESLQKLGKCILVKLSKDPSTVTKLNAKYLGRVIDSIEDLDSENSELSDVIILLHGLIVHCGFQKEYLESMKTAITLVLNHATPSAKIKIFAGISKVLELINFTISLPIFINAFAVNVKLD